MKNIAMVAATAVAFIAVPAKADETRLEARGGVVWFDGGEEAVAAKPSGLSRRKAVFLRAPAGGPLAAVRS